MTKEQARKKLALAASRQGLKVQVKSGKVKDAVRILNASGKVVAEGTLALDASKGYVNSDVQKTINQINTKLGKKNSMNSSKRKKMNASREYYAVPYSDARLVNMIEDDSFTDAEIYRELSNSGYDCAQSDMYTDKDSYYYLTWDGYVLEASRHTNSSKRKKMNAGCHSRKRLNSADDVESDEYIQDDAEFIEDVESVVTDEQGNEIVVEEMLVVQNPETNEISLFVPTEEDEAVPENVEVIGEVVTADDETTLDSSRRRVKMKSSKRTRR